MPPGSCSTEVDPRVEERWPAGKEQRQRDRRFPFRNSTTSGLDHSRPLVLGRQAWPEAGRSPECRNIEAIEARGEAEQSGMERETRSEGWRSQIATVGTVRGTYRHLVFAEGFNLCSPIARQPGKSRIALRSREEVSSGGVCPGQNRRWLLSPSLWDPAEALGGAQYFNIWLHAGASRACSSGPSPSPHRSGSRPVQY